MEEEIKETEEVIDGRTAIGRLPKKVAELEETQKEILETLAEHSKKIDICSIQR